MTLASHDLKEAVTLADDVLSITRDMEDGEEEGADGVVPTHKIVCDDNVTVIIACVVEFVKVCNPYLPREKCAELSP